jgi:hypothetical protein
MAFATNRAPPSGVRLGQATQDLPFQALIVFEEPVRTDRRGKPKSSLHSNGETPPPGRFQG